MTPVEVSVFPDTTLVARRRSGLVLDQSRNRHPAPRRGADPASARSHQDRGLDRRAPGAIRTGVEPRASSERSSDESGSRCSPSEGSVPGPRRATILDVGDADLVGIGRPFYAEPDLARRVLGGTDGPGDVATPTDACRRRCSACRASVTTPRSPNAATDRAMRHTACPRPTNWSAASPPRLGAGTAARQQASVAATQARQPPHGATTNPARHPRTHTHRGENQFEPQGKIEAAGRSQVT